MEYKVKKSVLNCAAVTTAISRAKEELCKQEVHENFGQEYVRAIRDKFLAPDYIKKLEELPPSVLELNAKSIESFDRWCQNYPNN